MNTHCCLLQNRNIIKDKAAVAFQPYFQGVLQPACSPEGEKKNLKVPEIQQTADPGAGITFMDIS